MQSKNGPPRNPGRVEKAAMHLAENRRVLLTLPSMRFNLSFPNKPFDVVGMGLNSVDFLSVIPEFPSMMVLATLIALSLLVTVIARKRALFLSG